MLIGEISKKTGLSRDTIRFYEKQGLIEVAKKERRFNNYKEYSEVTLQKLRAIKRIKGYGFTLNEVQEFLKLIEYDTASCENVGEIMLQKITLIDMKIKALQDMKAAMLNGIHKCHCCSDANQTENCMILTIDDFGKN